MIADALADWDLVLTERQVELPNPALAVGLEFLERTRETRGWGALPGLEYDRHASAVAMEALLSTARRSETNTLLLPTSQFLLNKYKGQFPGLGVDALIDVSSLLRDALDSDSHEQRAFTRRAQELLARQMEEQPPDAPRRVAALILALETQAQVFLEDRLRVCDFLVLQQNKAIGSWSTIPSNPGSLTATAEALRALALFDRDDAREARAFAFRYLEQSASTSVTNSEQVDTFDLSVTLRALASFPDASYHLVSALESELLRRQNADGGWPSSLGRQSAIELTGLAVLALDEAGAHAHVPARLGHAILIAASRELKGATGTNRALENGGQREAELQELRTQLDRAQEQASTVPELEHELRRVRRLANPVLYERELLSGRYNERMSRIALTVSIIAVAAGIGIATTAGHALTQQPLAIFLWSIAGVSTLAGLFAVIVLRRDARHASQVLAQSSDRAQAQRIPASLSELPGSLSELRRGLQIIVRNWPMAAREELTYLLYDLFLTVPSDIAERRAEQVAIDFGLGAEATAEFSAWAAAVGLLPESERRVLFDQVRRLLL